MIELAEFAVARHEPARRIPEHESLRDGFDRIAQTGRVLLIDAALVIRVGQPGDECDEYGRALAVRRQQRAAQLEPAPIVSGLADAEKRGKRLVPRFEERGHPAVKIVVRVQRGAEFTVRAGQGVEVERKVLFRVGRPPQFAAHQVPGEEPGVRALERGLHLLDALLSRVERPSGLAVHAEQNDKARRDEARGGESRRDGQGRRDERRPK